MVLYRFPVSVGRTERVHMTAYFIGVDQIIPDWLIKIMFLGEVETS